MSQPASQRVTALNRLKGEPLDLLIIGGGIVGAGIARDAAMRGLVTGLVDQHDFASGTSSRSSRLLHGGLRYLAQGHLGLVRESSVEKTLVHQIAPHLAEPLPFVFPTTKANRHWVLWQLKLGVKIYDLLCGGHNFGRSSWLNRNELAQKFPGLRREGVTGAVRYYDAFTNDARLTLDTLRSANKHGAALANYCQFNNAGRKEGYWEIELSDNVTGSTFPARSRTIVNASGPWASHIPHSQVKLHLSKGVHLVLAHQHLPVPETVVMTEGKRILFAIPWGDRTIIGTTDTDYKGPLDKVFAEPADIDYILSVANGFFPDAKLAAGHILSTWAGVRPLIADRHGNTSEVSRAHQIRNPEPGWWDVAGGKLTTYRLIAEQATDRILKEKAFEHSAGNKKWTECRTAKEPLLPASEIQGLSGILPPRFEKRAVAHYCTNEWALHLDDVMVRRTSWQHYLPAPAQRAEEVSRWMGDSLNWSEAARQSELESYVRTCSPVV